MNSSAFMQGYLHKEAEGFVDVDRMAADSLDEGARGTIKGFKSGGLTGLGVGAAGGAGIAALRKMLSEEDEDKKGLLDYLKTMTKGGLAGAAAGGTVGAGLGAYTGGMKGMQQGAINSMLRQADAR